MTELTADDLALLAADRCLVDVDVAAQAIWTEHAPGVPWGAWSDGSLAAERRTDARLALRSHDLRPGEPSLDLVVAAVERRGWAWEFDDGTAIVEHMTDGRRLVSHHADAERPALALALAYLSAVRYQEDRR